MHSFSYWEKTSLLSHPDVAIIGSGIVGLSAAIHLKKNKPNLKIEIYERGAIPSGASTKNAGFACFGSMTELVDDLKNMSENEVLDLVEMRWKGLLKLRKNIGDKAMNFKQLGGFELFLTKDETAYEECMNRLDFFNETLKDIIGIDNVFRKRDNRIAPLGFGNTKHIIHNSAEGQIDTGMMMKALIAKAKSLDIKIWNGMPVLNIEETSDGVSLKVASNHFVKAKVVLIATNGFANKLLKLKDLKPARNQVIITEPISDLPFDGCFHLDRGYFYFRSVDIRGSSKKRILFGGGRNLSPQEETTDEFGETTIIQKDLELKLHSVIYPKRKLAIDMRWSGILGIGSHKSPILKKISPHSFVAIRLGGMGVAIGSLIGEEAAKKILTELE